MENYLTIGEVSKITNIPISTLRYFDSEGIMKPYYKDEDTKYRYYKLYQITILKMIVHLKKLDVNNKDIKRYLENFDYSHALDMIKEMQEKTDKEIERLKLLKEQLIEDECEMKELKELEEKVDTFYIEDIEIEGIYCELSNENTYKSITTAMKKMDSFIARENSDIFQTKLFAFIIPPQKIEDKSYQFSKLVALKKFADYSKQYVIEKKKYLSIVCIGEFKGVAKNIEKSLEYMKKNGYKLNGDTLVNIITAPGFKKNPFETMYILKIPIK